ncbi:hypothetical protein HanXRQr2_Chr10g0465471 [Helianthus annuus]|uniref:Uncharacterized protein n=1 Tax=Helianthus annuus TaxID=4232 RepID=A0A9K3I1D9_HELAN|nr:uncharacterized protein LOC110886960 isoform X2 [Helianthus annuus]KAF5788574.1 hypothetical protein HanXRQr2_Chr10g0465471 [Helianthus annuus]KAJ0515616.1 hypothetical protein HanHA300_Chr10g0382421 [Helianthus annuus]KAJ0524186.1 hypothetical protein HanIR_Chr10g0501791 [Helianthus annuus]KAJ0531797.1 hypothetical protein HanHA89_Chr10g0404881 [Helianthus annuus]KAJ0698671.1 hypothetical protein HanLR1_Chr10g0382391 [Helianthus annuus]
MGMKKKKVSLGKFEYEAVENGTFSFPLTNLRDKLTITIQDAQGNQVSNSGVPTMSILEKGVWDDMFPIEGGGLIHMKFEFVLSDQERTRVLSMRESAIKKKQAEILGSRIGNAENAKFLASSVQRREVADVLRATSSLNATKSFDGKKEESFPRQSLTNATDKREETPVSRSTKETELNPNGSGNLVDKLKTNEASTSNKNNEFSLQQAEVPKKLLEDTKTRDFLKNNNNAVKTVLSDNRVEISDQQNLEDKKRSFFKKMSKDGNFPPFSQETEVNITKTNEIQLQDSSSSNAGSSRLTIAEKIKSLSPKLAGDMAKRASLEKTPKNIKKMISVFESSLSKDRVPIKPLRTKSNRFGTSRLLKDDTVKDLYEKPESNLNNSETSSSTRLRNSFSTGDLRKTISSEDQVEFDDDIVESAEQMAKEEYHQEKGEENESSEGPDIEASNGSFGQAMKIALVVGFGVVVFLFRPRETGKGKKENTRASRNVVMMNKRGSIEEQRRRVSVSRSS